MEVVSGELVGEFKSRAELFFNHLNFLGGWFSCSFWYDLWCGDSPFKKTSFQICLLRLAVDKKLQWLLFGQ